MSIQIYILLYKEVPIALKINSMYSKKRLLNIHENVRVLRYPDHITTGVYYWYAVNGLNSLSILIDIYISSYTQQLELVQFLADAHKVFLVTYRSHHEKLVIVDYQICFIGGLDLCFGRYDTNEHKVGDFPPLIWPGKDYYNPRYFISLITFKMIHNILFQKF